MRKILLGTLAITAATQLLASLPSGWVGRETCAACHEDTAAAFVNGPHGRLMADVAKGISAGQPKGETLDRSCETCHGPGAQHANDPTKGNIKNLKGATREASVGCLTCHAAQAGGLALGTPAHERAGVACLDCHASGHGVPAAKPLLVRPRSALCSSCHRTQVAQFNLPYAHRNGRTPFDCTDCHSVHGGTTVRSRIEDAGQQVCVKCHTEKAGPQVYPHPPQMINGCLACHQPHGSPNASMLTRAVTSQLCLECHTNTPSFHDLSQSLFRNCTNCHAAVHGSQRDPKLFKE